MEGVWNFRPMPARTMVCSGRPSISRFLNFTLPLVARVLPQIMSSTVVLPAPFGPMITRSSLRSR